MKENVRKAYQAGAFEPFMEVVKEVISQSQDVAFDPDPYKNAYNMGKRDKANSLLEEIEYQIKLDCK